MMAQTYDRETSISCDLARRILAAAGAASDFDGGADWYVACDADGNEYLTMGGHDLPIAYNPSGMSWLGSKGAVEARSWQPG